jgi:Spy/CpxP family protein refolding chaperone
MSERRVAGTMWSTGGLTIAVAVAFALCGASFAEAREGRGLRHGRGLGAASGGVVGIERLALTSEQKGELQRLRVEMRKEQIKRGAAAQVARIELAQLLAARELDDKAIAVKTRELVEAETALTRARLEHRAAVAHVLSPEQREQARDLHQMRGHARGGPGLAGRWGRRGHEGRGWRDDAEQ